MVVTKILHPLPAMLILMKQSHKMGGKLLKNNTKQEQEYLAGEQN